MTAFRIEAAAKLNLSLSISGRRADGYHELASAMVLVRLADRLLLLPGCSGLRVEGVGAGSSVPLARSENLAWRGLTLGLGGEPDLYCLTLEKQIPAAAGLGGGSSDAAAAWRIGRRLAGRPEEPDSEIHGELAQLGADVPFFAAATPAAWVTGIGERVRPLPPAALHVLIVVPPFGLATAAVFSELRRSDWSGAPVAEPAELQVGRNDLLAPARRLRPEIDDVFDAVAAAGGEPRLSGSGPAVFTVTDDPDRATAVARRLARSRLAVVRTRTASEAATIEALEETQEEA